MAVTCNGPLNFAVRSHLPFRLAWRDAFAAPLPTLPVLDRIAEFFIHASYPRSGGAPWALDFGDSGLSSNGAGSVTLLWALGHRTPAMLWYLKQFQGAAVTRGGEPNDAGLLLGSPRELLYAPTDAEIAAIPLANTSADSAPSSAASFSCTAHWLGLP